MRACLVFFAFVLWITSSPLLAAPPYRGGAAATQHPAATEAAVAMLNKGGNAVDAAVAAAFVLAVVAPYHSGVGGGGFALIHDAKGGKQSVLDFRETAPKAASRDMFIRDGRAVPELSQDGGLSVATPGAVAGYLALLKRFGKLSSKTVLAPAIAKARNGFRVTPKYQAMVKMRLDCLRRYDESARLFLRPNAQGVPDAPTVGELLRQPDLAKTLGAIAAKGAPAFYQGPTAQALAAAVKAAGGVMTSEDLAAYQVKDRQPLEGAYRGHRVVTMPPPSAGGLAVVQILSMLEEAGPATSSPRDVDFLHRFLESLRRVYVDRAKHLGDPSFNDIPIAKLTSKAYLQGLARTVDMKRATSSVKLLPADTGKPPAKPDAKNTSHVSVIDREGNAVALTTTVNYSFGSCVTAPGTGVLLNDEMDDFAAKPMTANVYGLVTGEANAVAPGKIPLSSMSPTLVFQKDSPNEILMSVGSPGGPTIPTTVLQVILNVVDFKMDIVRAVAAGRIHHQYLPDVVMVDRFGLEPSTARALEARGHQLQWMDAWGDAEAVLVDPTTKLRYAASDPRNEGSALGQAE